MRKQIVAFSLALLAASSPVAAQETSFLDDIRFFFLAFFDSTRDVPEIAPMIPVNGVAAQPEAGDDPEYGPMYVPNGDSAPAPQPVGSVDPEYSPMIVPNG